MMTIMMNDDDDMFAKLIIVIACSQFNKQDARITRAQLSLGEAKRTGRYLLLVYCLSPYACHYI